MRCNDQKTLRFVRAVLAGALAERHGDNWVAAGVRLADEAVTSLQSAGVLNDAGGPTPEARGWLRRQLAGEDAFRAQHQIRHQQGMASVDLSESPLLRLASGAEPFLTPHQVVAGERIRQLFERSQMRRRVTMSYSPDRVAGTVGGAAADPDDLAIDARRRLAGLLARMPDDCAGVVLDVCGYLKGLQVVESERGWPRRSAKLVLRIGLDHAAALLGLGEQAEGPDQSRIRQWGERPNVVG